VRKGLENPGVYAWGSNRDGVVDLASTETIIKTPRRIRYFDGKLLRDLKLDEKSGAAIEENGDLIQWGKGFSETDFQPTKTLTGRNLVSLVMSRDRIIALSSSGDVYSVPISKSEQETGIKPRESSWIPFYPSTSTISYRPLRPQLGLGEKVTSISGGSEHVVLLTNAGRVFTALATTSVFPARGQLGVPGLTWFTRPAGPVDNVMSLLLLKDSKWSRLLREIFTRFCWIRMAACSLLATIHLANSVFSLTPLLHLLILPPYYERAVSTRQRLDHKSYRRCCWWLQQLPDCGRTTRSGPGTEIAFRYRCCSSNYRYVVIWKGIYGTLGNGKWTHLQDAPTKVQALSGLSEYNEKSKKIEPIRLITSLLDRHMPLLC